MADVAAKTDDVETDENKPLIDSARSEPEGKESTIDRESRDMKTSSVYIPPTDVEGGPGGVYVGPGKDAVESETVEEVGGTDDSKKTEKGIENEEDPLPPPPPEMENVNPPDQDSPQAQNAINDTTNEEPIKNADQELATDGDQQTSETKTDGEQKKNSENNT